MIEDQRPWYPAGPSIVSGKRFDRDAIEFVWGNRMFRVADDRERGRVLGDPETYIRALDRAVIAAQGRVYGMPTKCPVQGDILDSDSPIDIVVANRMVRVCCARCVRVVRARPSQYLSMVEYADREAAAGRRTGETPP